MKSLPNIDILPVHEVKLPVLNKKVNFAPFNIEQEKSLITALDDENPNDIIRNYEQVLKACLKTDLDWDNLSVVDYITLVIWIRAKSKGESIELIKKKCKGCEKKFEFSVKIEDAIKFKNLGSIKKIVKITDDLSFEIAPLNYKFLFDLDKITDEMDMYVHTAKHCISKVFWQKEIYKAEPEELEEKVIKKLRRMDLEQIFKKYGDLVTVFMEVEYVCPMCNKTEKVIINNFLKSLK
jgi:hypothetical protein